MKSVSNKRGSAAVKPTMAIQSSFKNLKLDNLGEELNITDYLSMNRDSKAIMSP